MRAILCILFSMAWVTMQAQPPEVKLTPTGFAPIDVLIPTTANEKLIEVSKAWATEYNRRQKGYDVTDVTADAMKISAYKRNAFFYRERGETFQHEIRYTIELRFYSDHYGLQLTVNDIYADDDVLLEYSLPDYFNADGELKEGYTGLEESINRTVNDIIVSHYNFILNYR